MSVADGVVLLLELLIYFCVMAGLFRLRHRLGIGVFVCALGAMHFLETYLAAILYIQLFPGLIISPGSNVLFAGKLVLLLLVYIREDARTVRQPIYGLLAGNLLALSLVFVLRNHQAIVSHPGPADFAFMGEMGWLMLWGTLLLFIDSILIILIYERTAAWFGQKVTLRLCLSAALVLIFDQIGFFFALKAVVGVPYDLLWSGLIAKTTSALLYGLLAGAYLRWFDRSSLPFTRARLSDVFEKLTYRERYYELLEQAGTDALTGIRDRSGMKRQGQQLVGDALRRGQPISLLIIDIDGFKQVNDGAGHATGDEVLRAIGGTLKAQLRGSDRIFRYGGDEFVVFGRRLGAAEALSLGDRLKAAVDRLRFPALSRPVTVSIGLATSPGDATDFDGLFACADRRLYAAKRAGRNRIIGSEQPTV